MTLRIVHNAESVVMVQSAYPVSDEWILALVKRERGGAWQIPRVWKNTVDGIETVKANPTMNSQGWTWLVLKS